MLGAKDHAATFCVIMCHLNRFKTIRLIHIIDNHLAWILPRPKGIGQRDLNISIIPSQLAPIKNQTKVINRMTADRSR
ncbi:hypothetical protein D3C72_1168510 [compost metagenome]